MSERSDDTTAAHEARPAREEGSRPGVLLVENDPETQSSLAKALADSGARVVGTGSGEAALALLEGWRAGLVVIAEKIPGMSALEVARRIRAAQPGTPIVLMSEGESGEAAASSEGAGIFATLKKPFEGRLLAEVVLALAATSAILG